MWLDSKRTFINSTGKTPTNSLSFMVTFQYEWNKVSFTWEIFSWIISNPRHSSTMQCTNMASNIIWNKSALLMIRLQTNEKINNAAIDTTGNVLWKFSTASHTNKFRVILWAVPEYENGAPSFSHFYWFALDGISSLWQFCLKTENTPLQMTLQYNCRPMQTNQFGFVWKLQSYIRSDLSNRMGTYNYFYS